MAERFPDDFLRKLRNEIRFPILLARLNWPHSRRNGRLIFVCPCCDESRSDLNPQANLVRCFHCETNFNPIDFTMAACKCDFVQAVEYLTSLVNPSSG